MGQVFVPTARGEAAQFVIKEWHEGGRSYMEALGEFESPYHVYEREKMAEMVVLGLVERDLLSSFGD